MSDLKPCPFCGGEASIEKCWNFDDESPSGYFAWCHGNDCVVEPMTEDFKEEAEAIAVWNSRAERTCRNEHGHCSLCGAIMYDAPKYCSECGSKVVDA